MESRNRENANKRLSNCSIKLPKLVKYALFVSQNRYSPRYKEISRDISGTVMGVGLRQRFLLFFLRGQMNIVHVIMNRLLSGIRNISIIILNGNPSECVCAYSLTLSGSNKFRTSATFSVPRKLGGLNLLTFCSLAIANLKLIEKLQNWTPLGHYWLGKKWNGTLSTERR